jgi:hypothetical protein
MADILLTIRLRCTVEEVLSLLLDQLAHSVKKNYACLELLDFPLPLSLSREQYIERSSERPARSRAPPAAMPARGGGGEVPE